MDKSTLNYYTQYAEEFVNKTFSAPINHVIEKFTLSLPPGATVLDVGCGSGRDSLYFMGKGFDVVSFDAAPEIARIASTKIGKKVLCLDIESMPWTQEFDGVWAMASLLHLKRDELPNALQKCIDALKPNGKLFVSLKIGSGEGYDENGRFFTYYNQDELTTIFSQIPDISHFNFNINDDKLGRDVQWLNIHASKLPALTKKIKNN